MFCPACGTELPLDSAFCLKCGRSMALPPSSAGSVPSPANKSETKFAAMPNGRKVRPAHVLIAFLVAAALAGVAAYSLHRLQAEPIAATRDAALSSHTPADAPKAALPVKLSPGEIAAKYSGAVVVLQSYNESGQPLGQGSGFIFGRVVFTNYHVIRGASRVTARLRDDSTREVEYVWGFDIDNDVAALKLDAEGLPSVNLGDSSGVTVGDHVTFLGAPLGLESTLSDGIISAVRDSGPHRAFQTSAPISHGSSGGPLFDDYGNVVGLAVGAVETGENLNFAVPISFAARLLKENQQMPFALVLASTKTSQTILSAPISVPPQVVSMDVLVPPQGGVLSGVLSISGGMGNDLGLGLVSASGASVWNGGVVRNLADLTIPVRGGRYKLILNNKEGPFWVSAKTVSGSLMLTYYR